MRTGAVSSAPGGIMVPGQHEHLACYLAHSRFSVLWIPLFHLEMVVTPLQSGSVVTYILHVLRVVPGLSSTFSRLRLRNQKLGAHRGAWQQRGLVVAGCRGAPEAGAVVPGS